MEAIKILELLSVSWLVCLAMALNGARAASLLEGDGNMMSASRVVVQEERGPTQIGVYRAIRISSETGYSDIQPTITSIMVNGESPRHKQRAEYVLRGEKGSPFLAVHFDLFDFAPDCAMEITDALGGERTHMAKRGRQNRSEFWAHHVAGDEMYIVVECNAGGLAGGVFEIDTYVAGSKVLMGTSQGEDRQNEHKLEDGMMRHLEGGKSFIRPPRNLGICTNDDKKTAVCYSETHPLEYETAKGTARIYVKGAGACTGWMITEDLLITNEHCIKSSYDVLNSDFEFNVEADTCESDDEPCWLCGAGETFDGIELVASNKMLDFSLIRLDGKPGLKYGTMEMEYERQALLEELIYIPQHPGARPRMLALEDSAATENQCQVKSVMGRNCANDRRYSDIKYSCDTEGGTSGAPVISRLSNRVIALHHCGGECRGNMGVPIFIIYDHLQQHVFPDGVDCKSRISWEFTLYTQSGANEFRYTLRSATTGDLIGYSTAFKSDSSYKIVKCLDPGTYNLDLQNARGNGLEFYRMRAGTNVLTQGGNFGRMESITFTLKPPQPPTPQPSGSPSLRPSISNQPTVTATFEPSGIPSLRPSNNPTSDQKFADKIGGFVEDREDRLDSNIDESLGPIDGGKNDLISETRSCINDNAWDRFGFGQTSCSDWVAESPERRCRARARLSGTFAFNSCENICRCHENCIDSSTWENRFGNNCEWVAEAPETRCGEREGYRGEWAFEACAKACSCTLT